MFLFRKKEFFTSEEKETIVKAVQSAEHQTSGEIRVYIESKCQYVDPMDRAIDIFAKLEMEKTKQRNGVLLYIAVKDQQFAIYGDEGIHQKVGDHFWKRQAIELKKHFQDDKYAEGIANCVKSIGDSLKKYFPYQSDDENELPDDIVFGR